MGIDNLNAWPYRVDIQHDELERMGEVYKFRRKRRQRRARSLPMLSTAILGGVLLGLGAYEASRQPTLGSSRSQDGSFACAHPQVVDGDTLRCGSTRVRLSGIDAPELPGHCRPGRDCTPGDPYASTDNLRQLIGGGSIDCRQTDIDDYGRVVALCSAAGRDLSCEQVRGGFAVKRYAPLSC